MSKQQIEEMAAFFSKFCEDVLGAHFNKAIALEFADRICDAGYRKQSVGEWIGRPLCGNANCRCSVCGAWWNVHANLRGDITQKHCPTCGAKMKGGE